MWASVGSAILIKTQLIIILEYAELPNEAKNASHLKECFFISMFVASGY